MGFDDQTSAGAPLINVLDDDVKALSVCTKPKIGSSDTDDRKTRHFMLNNVLEAHYYIFIRFCSVKLAIFEVHIYMTTKKHFFCNNIGVLCTTSSGSL